jgi:hypothetical protein
MSVLISHPHGMLVVAADNPYQREVAFELADSCARRYGRVAMAFGRGAWSVTATDDRGRCAHCGHSIVGVMYKRAQRRVCSRCARRESA